MTDRVLTWLAQATGLKNLPKEIKSKRVLKEIFPDLLILGKLGCPSFWEGQATGVAGTSLAQSQAEVASVA